jgi:hypothetical protein
MEIDLGLLIGTLGAYFALMAVLAAGTEVVLDMFKLRFFQRKPDPLATLEQVKEWLPKGDTTNLTTRWNSIAGIVTNLGGAITDITKHEEIARGLQQLQKSFDQSEQVRLRQLRLVSVIIGVILAFLMQVNTFALLKPLVHDAVAAIETFAGGAFFLIGGFFLSGFGASLGSSFWHDQLDRLRQVKKIAKTVDEVRLSLAEGPQ